jgi:hypothetical protein
MLLLNNHKASQWLSGRGCTTYGTRCSGLPSNLSTYYGEVPGLKSSLYISGSGSGEAYQGAGYAVCDELEGEVNMFIA